MSGFDVDLTITGIQAVQAANLRAIAAMKPSGALGRAVLYGTTEAHRYAVAITHVDMGALQASHRIKMKQGGLRGEIYIDPATTNPRSGQRPVVYGFYEHERGGSHAFYARVEKERGAAIGKEMGRIVGREVG